MSSKNTQTEKRLNNIIHIVIGTLLTFFIYATIMKFLSFEYAVLAALAAIHVSQEKQ